MANQGQVVLRWVPFRANCAPLVLPTDLQTGQLHDPGGKLTPYSIVYTPEPVHGRHEQATRVTGLNKAQWYRYRGLWCGSCYVYSKLMRQST